MRIVYFTHSLSSCWNHGNAHFLRGLLRELGERGHSVTAYEPADGWSRQNLVADHGEEPLRRFRSRFPSLDVRSCDASPDLPAMLEGAGLVVVHEWTEPRIASAIGALRKHATGFVLLFHDTHHRAISDAAAMSRFDLSGYDGVLAFGASLADHYARAGWGRNAFVFHEAADTHIFHPITAGEDERCGVVWIGNWGDDERSEQLATFLLRPARDAGLPLATHGVRYPVTALQTLSEYGASYHGWIANSDVPRAFARHKMTVHVPRRFYTGLLPGIPTIRVFEALACGIPLLCAPWQDSEGLFRPGEDYLVANSEGEMSKHMRAVAADRSLRQALVRSGLERINARHTCRHRADELLAIAAQLRPQLAEAV